MTEPDWRPRASVLSILLLLASMAWAGSPGTQPSTLMRIGFGRVDITPPVGAEIPGLLVKKVSVRVSDPLYVAAAAFEQGDQRLVIVGIDSLCILESSVREVRSRIEKELGVPGNRVMIAASHTHTGGPVRPSIDGRVDEQYMKFLHDSITGAVVAAWKDRSPAEFAVTRDHAPGLAFNRRFLMRDGREATQPGKPGIPHHDEIVRPAGPADDTVGVLPVRTGNGTPRGAIVHFACHNTIMNDNTFSADYVGALRQALTNRYGKDFQTLFLLGPCGDVTQLDNYSPDPQMGRAYCDFFGGRLAEAVFRAMDHVAWQGGGTMNARQIYCTAQIRPDPDVEREKPIAGLGLDNEPFFAKERELVAAERREHPNVQCEVQAFRIGPLAIVANGSELFCSDGTRIRECSRFEQTWVATLTNQWLGYVPTANACVAGGYEPRTRRGSKLAIDTAQRIVEASVEALRQIGPP